MKVEIINKETLFNGFLNLEKVDLKFEKFDGELSDQVTRLHVYRGDAVAILLYNSIKKTFLFVKQFRYPIHTVEKENGWTMEVVAGAMEKDHTAQETAVREIEEETGYDVAQEDLEYITKIYPSPGATSERIYLYIADIKNAVQINSGGGLDHESEDIKLIELPYATSYKMIQEGKICDAKSLITLLWFQTKQMIPSE